MHNAPIMNIPEEFSRSPGPRFIEDGSNSGEKFRDEYLIPWLEQNKDAEKLIIEMDGAISYPTSFLEEAFGGAVRKGYLAMIEKIDFKYSNIRKKKRLETYIENARENEVASDKR